MIIVEGPDGAGKSTLIKTLSDRYDIPVAPRVVTKDTEAMIDLQQWVDENLEAGFQRTIFDRHRLISEPIYGPILRNAQADGFNDFSWLSRRLQKLYWRVKPIIIYCLPPIEQVMHNVMMDPDNRVVRGRIEGIYASYVAKASIDKSLAIGETFIYDYTNPSEDLDIMLHRINRYATEKVKYNER